MITLAVTTSGMITLDVITSGIATGGGTSIATCLLGDDIADDDDDIISTVFSLGFTNLADIPQFLLEEFSQLLMLLLLDDNELDEEEEEGETSEVIDFCILALNP